MQSKIKILEPQEAIKIAAGEVIERPAHLIKELIENSIDAGATTITLYLQAAGKDFIKIIDDGCGMSELDAKLCFAHHATSKIISVNDLDAITTYGFRGEALSSIASVSKVELFTKTADEKVATHITIEHGKITSQQQAAHHTGTTFVISNLFDNIPARKKFLKADETEWNAILTIFQAFCLRYPHINFKLHHNDFLAYNCPATTELTVRCAQLWNNNLHNQLLTTATTTQKDFIISGAISSPHYYRFNRGQIFTFVNNRWVKNQEITKGIVQGYDGVLPHQKYPAAFIFIDIDPKLIDVNIHPKKEEVKFLHPGIIQKAVATLVKNTLNEQLNKKLQSTSINHVHVTAQSPVESITSLPEQIAQPAQESISTEPISIFAKKAPQPFAPQNNNVVIPQKKIELSAPTQTPLFQEPIYTIIGQLKKTYILIELEQELLLVDQHAAHERIIYQRLLQQDKAASIHLMFPHIIKLTSTALQKLIQHQHLLEQHAIVIETFSQQELILQATPIGMSQQAAEEIIRTLCDQLEQQENITTLQINETIISNKACKTACKAGDNLDTAQMQTLIKELLTVEDRFSCPHGRPTMWNITFKEIEKHFKRDYVGSKQSNQLFL